MRIYVYTVVQEFVGIFGQVVYKYAYVGPTRAQYIAYVRKFHLMNELAPPAVSAI